MVYFVDCLSAMYSTHGNAKDGSSRRRTGYGKGSGKEGL